MEQQRRGLFTKLTGRLASSAPKLYEVFCLGLGNRPIFSAFEDGRRQEREACAKLCESEDVAPSDDAVGVQMIIAAKIRARSNI